MAKRGEWELPEHPEITAAVLALAAGGEVSDRDVDRWFPKAAQKWARIHWTPTAVARRAAAFLVRAPEDRVLDVGSGGGKFCLVGALTTRGRFLGVEAVAELAKAASAVATKYRIAGARFRCGDATERAAWAGLNGVYLYNPFTAESGTAGIDLALLRLREAPSGLRAVTFCGIGAQMPAEYALVNEERTQAGPLAYWEKR